MCVRGARCHPSYAGFKGKYDDGAYGGNAVYLQLEVLDRVDCDRLVAAHAAFSAIVPHTAFRH